MTEESDFVVGDEVMAVAGAKGTVADIRNLSSGETAYGVVDANGAVRYYTKSGLKRFL